MKYIVVLGDGMGDYPLDELGGKTPLQYARTPEIDYLVKRGALGTVRTIPEGMAPGSDTANLSVIGYSPRDYYTGRSPFEAAGMGINMEETDISFRCNLVTLSGDEPYASKTMVDYSSGEITSDESGELIEAVNKHLGGGSTGFYPGKSYRHLMLCSDASLSCSLTPPHDISGRKIGPFLPSGKDGNLLREMMEKSAALLAGHRINRLRLERGLNPANSIWLWGEGRRPRLPLFCDKYRLKGSLISAVDLLKGIAYYAGLDFIEVDGATGKMDSNLRGKADAAIDALRGGKDFVYVHIEAPDECGHQFEIANKVRAIELIDNQVVAVIREQLNRDDTDYKIMILTDHYTPLSLGTHTTDPVPFLIYHRNYERSNPAHTYDELCARNADLFINEGHKLMDYFLR